MPTLERTCSSCHTPLPEEARFCLRCGAPTPTDTHEAVAPGPPEDAELQLLKEALADRYAVESVLGFGGMARVYLAEDLKHRRKVAVKVLRSELAAALGAERFLREIEIAARLQHPHILMLIDSGEADGFLYYVMPYVEGESLRERLARDAELPVPEAVRILRDVADALAHAHAHDVVHRDIKPDNVMLSGRHALVTDFGVAKAVSHAGHETLTTAGISVGTPTYMAPEQATADPNIDHRADIYALGVLGYELLAGEPPITGENAQAVLSAHVLERPRPLTELRPNVPVRLSQAIMRCLEKKAADRWQSAEELLPQLEALVTPSGDVTPTGRMPVNRVAKRRWMMAGAAAAVAVVIAVIAVVAGIPRGSGARLDPNHVVVAPFRNATGDPSLDQLGERVGHWVTQGIQQAAIAVTPWDQALQSWQYVQTEAEAGRVRDPVRALAEETGAGVVVSGAVYAVGGDSLEVQVNVTDATRGRLLGALDPLRASRASESEVIRNAQQRVMVFLASRFEEAFQGYVPPEVMDAAPTFEAYEAFEEGFRISHGRDWEEAIPYFRSAFESDSTWALPLLKMWSVLVNLGRVAERDSVVTVLEGLWNRLTPYERAVVQSMRALTDGDREQQVVHLRRAVELAPRSPSVNNLAWSLSHTNRPREARDVLLTVDPERGSWRTWAIYWRNLTTALLMLGEYEQVLEAAQRCRHLHPQYVWCPSDQANALASLGRVQELADVLDELEAMPDVSRWPGALVFNLDYLRYHGRLDVAKDVADRAIRWFEARPPNEATTLVHRHHYGRALFFAGRLEEAQRVFDGIVDDFPDNTYNRAHRAFVAAMRGDTAQALSDADWLERHAETLDEGRAKYQARWWYRGIIYGALGDRERFMDLFRQYEPHWIHNAWWHVWVLFEPMRGYPPFEELIMPKG